MTILFAGHHTTAMLAAWSVVELLRRPEHLDAVLAEQKRIFTDGISISLESLKRLEVLERFIMHAHVSSVIGGEMCKLRIHRSGNILHTVEN